MTGNDLYGLPSAAEILFQLCKGLHRQLVILSQRADKAVAAVRTEPDRIAGKQILIIDEVDHVSPSVSGNQNAFDFDVPDLKHFAVFQQNLPIIRLDHRKPVCSVEHLPPDLAGQIPVLNLPDIHCRVLEQKFTVPLQGTDVVRILMRDQDMFDRCRVQVQPAHFFFQSGIIVARIDHDRGAVLRIKENICHPLTHTGHMLVDPAGVQRFEDRLAPKQSAHGFLLIL